jgi:hypothetical protein
VDVLRFTTVDGVQFMLGGISSAVCCMMGAMLAASPWKGRTLGWVLGFAGVAGIVAMVIILATYNPVAGGG